MQMQRKKINKIKSLKRRPQRALAACATHSKRVRAPVASALPPPKVVSITKTSETNCRRRRRRLRPGGCWFRFTPWLPLPPVLLSLSLCPATQLWGTTGSSWCERRGRSSRSKSVTSACRTRASTPARCSPCRSRPPRPFSPCWVSAIRSQFQSSNGFFFKFAINDGQIFCLRSSSQLQLLSVADLVSGKIEQISNSQRRLACRC